MVYIYLCASASSWSHNARRSPSTVMVDGPCIANRRKSPLRSSLNAPSCLCHSAWFSSKLQSAVGIEQKACAARRCNSDALVIKCRVHTTRLKCDDSPDPNTPSTTSTSAS